MPLTRTLNIHALEVLCSIGAHDHERSKKQRVLIDITLSLTPESEPQDDSLTSTLDYDKIRETIIAIATAQHYDLQETLARALFDALTHIDQVTSVTIKTQKPDAYPDCDSIAYTLATTD